MKAQVKSTRGTSFTPSLAPQRSPAVPQHKEEPASRDAPAPLGSGHDFGQIRVHAGTRGGQAAQRAPESCPLGLSTPRSCPFGGACHTCPAPVQAKLTVNRPGDEYEQEADRVADQVMRMPEPRLQRQEEEPEEEEEAIQAKPVAEQITPLVQRQEEEPEKEEESVQAKPVTEQITPLVQRQEKVPEEEEEPVQASPLDSARLQRQEEPEEEEDEEKVAQARRVASQIAPLVQRQEEGPEEEEDEEPVQASPLDSVRLQRQEEPEEEEESVQAKPVAEQITPLVQRQEEGPEEEEEPIQTKPLDSARLQRQEEEPEEEEEEGEPIQTKPARAARVMRQEAECEDCEEEPVQTKQAGGPAPQVRPGLAAQIRSSRGSGQCLPQEARGSLEARFGYDFGDVRVHAGGESAQMTQKLRAKAFTVGRDVHFAAGKYDPATSEGKRLLAHELTHVVQQNPSLDRRGVRQTPGAVGKRMPVGTVAGDWLVRTGSGPRPSYPPDKSDEELAEELFRKICPLVTRTGPRIQIPMGVTSASNPKGCGCLQDIKRGLTTRRSPTYKRSRPPAEIRLDRRGWSRAYPWSDPVKVWVRHPKAAFRSGHWTLTERRHIAPLWTVMAHEICGHVLTYVRTRGAHVGGRTDNPRRHDPAIEAENVIAEEHGVPWQEWRGYEFAPGGRPRATRHAGESFMAETIDLYRHGSDTSWAWNAVLDSAVTAMDNWERVYRSRLRVELVGKAYANEGGRVLAVNRARAVRDELIRRGAEAESYWVRGRVVSGTSNAFVSAQRGREVDVYLFHSPRAAGP